MPKTAIKNKQVLYAFWDYDLCPYILGGIVTEFTGEGHVRAKGYDGMAFRPIAIIPDENGKRALARLQELRNEYAEKEKALKIDYKNRSRICIGLEIIE